MSENLTPRVEQEAGSDLTSENGVVDHMSAATSKSDWNNRCDEVKAANGGDYPAFWFGKVIMSGLLSRVSAKW